MTNRTLRNSIIAATAAVAMIGAGSLAAPSQAQAHGRGVAAFLGGLAVAGIIANSYHPYAVYGAPVYYSPRCHWEKRKFWTPYGHRYWRNVKVCY